MGHLRNTGLIIHEQVQWGDHLCAFYESKDDLLELLVPYFKAGLESNESCLWVTSDCLSPDDAKSALEAVVPDLDIRITNGQMEIITEDQCYFVDGVFDGDAVLDSCYRKEQEVLAKGYDGLRAAGNSIATQNEYWEEWIAYENKIQRELRDHRIITICPHALLQCSASQYFQAVDSHDIAIARRNGQWECVNNKYHKQLLQRLYTQKHALRSSISPLVMTDLEGRLSYANPATVKTWGYDSESEMLGGPVNDFWHDADQIKEVC